MGFISGSLVGGSDMGPFSCYREAAAGAGLAELAVHVGEGRFQRLTVQAVADDFLPAEDEVLGLELVHTLLLQVGFQLGPDGLGDGLLSLFVHLTGRLTESFPALTWCSCCYPSTFAGVVPSFWYYNTLKTCVNQVTNHTKYLCNLRALFTLISCVMM